MSANGGTTAVALSGLGIVADMYDLQLINLVRPDLEQEFGVMTPGQDAVVTTSALIGCIVGMVLFGMLADRIGRWALFVTTSVIIGVTSLGSALARPTFGLNVFQVLTFWRFLMGVGIGGEYPLAAATVAENVENKNAAQKITIVFSQVAVGSVAGPVIVIFIGWVLPASHSAWGWRLAFGFGCILSAIAATLRLWLLRETVRYGRVQSARLNAPEGSADEAAGKKDDDAPKSLAANPWALKYMWKELLGTAGSWFIFDVTAYGVGMYTSTIFKAGQLSPQVMVLVINLIQVPGLLIAIIVVPLVFLRNQQMYGLACMAGCFFLMCAFMDVFSQSLQLLLLGLMRLFDAFGGGVPTYVIPALIFPTPLRGTAHGFSASAGKLGAVLGSLGFPLLKAHVGLRATMLICGLVGLFAAAWTWMFVPLYTVEDLDRIATEEAAGRPVEEVAQFAARTYAATTCGGGDAELMGDALKLKPAYQSCA